MVDFSIVFCMFTRGSERIWWLIPLSKWDITPVINGISRVNPLITGVITHLLSGMSHQVSGDVLPCVSMPSPVSLQRWHVTARSTARLQTWGVARQSWELALDQVENPWGRRSPGWLCDVSRDMGLSENSVPLHPMVNDHYPY